MGYLSIFRSFVQHSKLNLIVHILEMHRSVFRSTNSLFRRRPQAYYRQASSFSSTSYRQNAWVNTCADIFVSLPNYPPFSLLPESHAYTGVLIVSAVVLRSLTFPITWNSNKKGYLVAQSLQKSGLTRENHTRLSYINKKIAEDKNIKVMTEKERFEAIANNFVSCCELL